MPRDTNGTTQPLPGTIVSTGDTILPSQHNPMVNDVYAMLTQSLSRDGQGGMRAPLDMSNFRVINVAAATQPNDAVSLSQFQTGSPIGTVVDFAGVNAPATWMFCYGQAVSRANYADLYASFGGSASPYGQGDGTTTFNLPDCRGRVIAAKDNMGGTAAARLNGSSVNGSQLGATGGVPTVAITEAQMPSHFHSGTTSTNGDHNHGYPGDSGVGGGSTFQGGFRQPSTYFTTTNGAHNHNLTTDAKGGGQAHENVQPTIVMNKIIKVSY